MGLDYWSVHFVWTIPPAVIMTLLYWPFLTRLELYKMLTLITVAVVATIPWDSYLIRTRVWTYPVDGLAGHQLYSIPLEEVFFFVVQSYNTALLYTLLTKRLVMPTYIRPYHDSHPVLRRLVTWLISAAFVFGVFAIWAGGRATYLGLILVWVSPVVMFQCPPHLATRRATRRRLNQTHRALSRNFLLQLPRRELLVSILLPSIYFAAVDNMALQRGVWTIESSTKLDFQLYGALEIEEAFFFFVTNVMIVLGLVSMDYVVAIADYQIAMAPDTRNRCPSLFGRLSLSLADWPEDENLAFLRGLAHAVTVVSSKSQSMYMGSAMFQGGLRIDLLLLYYFCRVTDDLVDEAPNRQSAQLAIEKCSRALNSHFGQPYSEKPPRDEEKRGRDDRDMPPGLLASVSLLPASRLTIEPFLSLLAGFKTDLNFSAKDASFPIETEQDLNTYAYNVAGSVAASMIQLVFSHYQPSGDRQQHTRIINAGENMGQALQYVNIARDIEHDAAIGRVYLPTCWLAEQGLKPTDVLASPNSAGVKQLRDRMLDMADAVYLENVAVIDELPREIRGPIRTVVESYMMIGTMVRKDVVRKDVVRQDAGSAIHGSAKLKLSLWRRLGVAWWAMC